MFLPLPLLCLLHIPLRRACGGSAFGGDAIDHVHELFGSCAAVKVARGVERGEEGVRELVEPPLRVPKITFAAMQNGVDQVGVAVRIVILHEGVGCVEVIVE